MTRGGAAAERRAREARERQEAAEKWEAEKPMRLLKALALADNLGVPARVFYRGNEELYWAFGDTDPSGMVACCDTFAELSDHGMWIIENRLEGVAAEQNRKRRLGRVKEEVLGRLTAEEKEALGFS